jgi:integrase
VKNPEPKPGEIHPFDSWEEIDAIADELDATGGPDAGQAARGSFSRRRRVAGSTSTTGATDGGRRRFIVSSFTENKKNDDRQNRSRYADPDTAITPICEDFLAQVGITNRSAYSCLCRRRHNYDLRHTYATWSLAAGVDIFTLARRMGTSVKMPPSPASCARWRAACGTPAATPAATGSWSAR